VSGHARRGGAVSGGLLSCGPAVARLLPLPVCEPGPACQWLGAPAKVRTPRHRPNPRDPSRVRLEIVNGTAMPPSKVTPTDGRWFKTLKTVGGREGRGRRRQWGEGGRAHTRRWGFRARPALSRAPSSFHTLTAPLPLPPPAPPPPPPPPAHPHQVIQEYWKLQDGSPVEVLPLLLPGGRDGGGGQLSVLRLRRPPGRGRHTIPRTPRRGCPGPPAGARRPRCSENPSLTDTPAPAPVCAPPCVPPPLFSPPPATSAAAETRARALKQP
jgi:hypothetical protein